MSACSTCRRDGDAHHKMGCPRSHMLARAEALGADMDTLGRLSDAAYASSAGAVVLTVGIDKLLLWAKRADGVSAAQCRHCVELGSGHWVIGTSSCDGAELTVETVTVDHITVGSETWTVGS